MLICTVIEESGAIVTRVLAPGATPPKGLSSQICVKTTTSRAVLPELLIVTSTGTRQVSPSFTGWAKTPSVTIWTGLRLTMRTSR